MAEREVADVGGARRKEQHVSWASRVERRLQVRVRADADGAAAGGIRGGDGGARQLGGRGGGDGRVGALRLEWSGEGGSERDEDDERQIEERCR